MKNPFIFFLRFYQKAFSPDQGLLVRYHIKPAAMRCCFYPTCSEYTILAIKKYSTLKGIFLGGRRILRCHPWQKEFIDLP